MNQRELRGAGAAGAGSLLAWLLVAATLLGGCGGLQPPRTAPGPRVSATTSTTSGADPTAPFVAAHRTPRPADRRSAALRHLQAVLVRTLRHEGTQTGAYVYDLSEHRALFTLRARVPRSPASVEKIYTSVALLRLLGPQADLHTELYGTGHLGRHGVWHGNLYLRGDGDPTFGDGWYDRTYEGGYGSRVTDLVAQLRRVGIRRVAGWIYGDGSRFDTSTGGPATAGRPDTPDYGGEMSALVYDHGASSRDLSPPAFAAHELALTLRAEHVFGRVATRARRTPRGARRLAVVKSPRLPILLKLMDVPSDDLFADLLTKQLGFHLLGRGTLNAGASEIRDALTPYHLEAIIHDGSGLDRRDLTTPQAVVSLLRQTWNTSVGRTLAASLPVVGISGTVQSMAVRTPAQGHCVAKTGTLNDVTNLAGICAARGRHELLFALFVDGPVNWEAYGALGRMVAAIAAY